MGASRRLGDEPDSPAQRSSGASLRRVEGCLLATRPRRGPLATRRSRWSGPGALPSGDRGPQRVRERCASRCFGTPSWCRSVRPSAPKEPESVTAQHGPGLESPGRQRDPKPRPSLPSLRTAASLGMRDRSAEARGSPLPRGWRLSSDPGAPSPERRLHKQMRPPSLLIHVERGHDSLEPPPPTTSMNLWPCRKRSSILRRLALPSISVLPLTDRTADLIGSDSVAPDRSCFRSVPSGSPCACRLARPHHQERRESRRTCAAPCDQQRRQRDLVE